MVSIRMKVGPKGQVVIPKVIRDEYNINPGDNIMFREENNKTIIEKDKIDPIAVFKKAAKSKKKIKFKFDPHAIEMEYEERWRKVRDVLHRR